MSHINRLLSGAAVLSLLLGSPALEAQETGVATLQITTETGERDASVLVYRQYGNPATLDFVVSIDNGTSTPLTLSFSALMQLHVTVLQSGSPIPVVTQWDQTLFRGGIATPAATNQPFATGPGESWEVHMSMRRQDDQPFQTGRYTFRFFTSDVFNAALDDRGIPWPGRFMPGGGDMLIDVGPPRGTPREQSRASRQDGQRALKAGRQTEAIAALQQAVNADPSDITVLMELGTLYIQSRRFSDAIGPLENATNLLSRLGSERTNAYRLLAMAYLGVNDQTNAARVLRQGGEGAQIPELIQQLRNKLSLP